MSDTFITLYNRLLTRVPAIGTILAQQFIGDSWRTLQSRRQWSWRRGTGVFVPTIQYQTGTASTNVAAGNPTMITGIGTTWTPQMVGQQIRLNSVGYPWYTIVGFVSATSLLIDQPWAGPDLTASNYQILQVYYQVPNDYGYWYNVISPRDGYCLTTTVTAAEIDMFDPQRTTQGQTYCVAFHDYVSQYGGTISAVIPVIQTGAAPPISTTTTGYTYVTNATYIIKVTGTGIAGVATYQWMRSGQTAFSLNVTTADTAQNLADGVQVYWPDGVTYNNGDCFVINGVTNITQSTPRFELWPTPTNNQYLYTFLYIRKEYDLTDDKPYLPPPIAARGEVLLEMALMKAATFPGVSKDQPNPYYSLPLSAQHKAESERLINDLERNDEEVGLSDLWYNAYPFYPAPWETGQWQQTHAPWISG